MNPQLIKSKCLPVRYTVTEHK